MKVEEILKLLNAGYTKEEITALENGAEPPKAEPPKAEPPKAEPPKAEPPKEITISEEQLQKLIQGVAVQTASGKIELPKSIDETLTARLNSILKGE